MSRTPSLDELRAQARRSYRFWPIYLVLRQRQLEQHLTPAERVQLGVRETQETDRIDQTAILREYGLLSGEEELPRLSLPDSPMPQAERSGFEVRAEGATTSLYLWADALEVELLRVRAQDGSTLADVAAALQRLSAEVSPQAAYDAARLWAALHGARLLDWVGRESPQAQTVVEVAALPPRRRGRGVYREPG